MRRALIVGLLLCCGAAPPKRTRPWIETLGASAEPARAAATAEECGLRTSAWLAAAIAAVRRDTLRAAVAASVPLAPQSLTGFAQGMVAMAAYEGLTEPRRFGALACARVRSSLGLLTADLEVRVAGRRHPKEERPSAHTAPSAPPR